MGHQFLHRPQVHAEIQIVQRPVAQDSALPTRLVYDFFDFLSRSRPEEYQPLVPAKEARGRSTAAEPLIAEQKANRISATTADPVEHERRFEIAKIVVSDMRRIWRRRAELSLEPQTKSIGT